MASFQSTLLIIATVFLIIILVLFAYSLHNQKQKQKWPPTESSCPDYWVDNGTNGSNCRNVLGLGEETCKSDVNFSTAPYVGTGGTCEKKVWANGCKVTWDGITYGYGNNNPCSPSSSSSSTAGK
jgi:hypothetical protein